LRAKKRPLLREDTTLISTRGGSAVFAIRNCAGMRRVRGIWGCYGSVSGSFYCGFLFYSSFFILKSFSISDFFKLLHKKDYKKFQVLNF
jgi:hypothetical protein